MKIVPAIALMLLCSATTAQAAEPINILGLPLGAKLKTPIRQCAPNEQNTDVTSLCWVHKPELVAGGARSGIVAVPGAERRPEWAAQKTLQVYVESDGTLSAITFHTARPDEFDKIAHSVSESFRPPKRTSGANAAWNWQDTLAELRCSKSGCETAFRLADSNANRQPYGDYDGPRYEAPAPATKAR